MFENRVVNGRPSTCQTASFPAGVGFPWGITVAFHCARFGEKNFKQHLRNIEYSLVCFEVWICSHFLCSGFYTVVILPGNYY